MSTGANGRDPYRFDDEQVAELDAVLRDEAAGADTVEACVDAVTARLDEDRSRIRIRAIQLELYDPDWPSHVTRADVVAVAERVDTLSEVADELRLTRRKTKRVLRWAGVSDEVERTTMLTVLNKVRDGDLDAQANGGED